MIDGADTAQAAPLGNDPGDQNAAGTRRLNKARSQLLTVNISGVTIDGDGVYAEAGILFRDAQGRITRSRITNIVTTETSLRHAAARRVQGLQRRLRGRVGHRAGPGTAGRPQRRHRAAARRHRASIQVDHTRIDKYNRPACCSTARPATRCR